MEIWSSLLDLGFPIAVAVFLLTKNAKQLEKVREEMAKMNIGLHLLLHALNIRDEYTQAVEEYEKKKPKREGVL